VHIVHRGVYAVGHAALSVEGRLMAAVLAHGPGAVLSHRSAAERWNMLRRSASPRIDVTIPRRGGLRRRPPVVVHHAPGVRVTTVDGFPVTTVAWTMLDLAASAPERLVEQAVEGAERAGVLDLAELREVTAVVRPGVRVLREALAEFDDAPTNRELERLFLQLCRDHGLPRPHVNVWVEGALVDFFWPEARLIVETDGLETHGTRAAVERDHGRDAVHALAGHRTQRFTWRQVTREPAMVAEVVRHLLAERLR
jgi:very-short-patch-repair endonuclease